MYIGLKNYIQNSKAKMSKDSYLEMCESMGIEPSLEDVPLEFMDFPINIQSIIKLFSMLPDRWDSFQGIYLGKDYSILPFLLDNVVVFDDVPFIITTLKKMEEIYNDTLLLDNHKKKEKEAQDKKKNSFGTHNLKSVPKAGTPIKR